MESTIAVLSDSLGVGFYDWECGGWVSRLRAHFFMKSLDSDDYVAVYNFSRDGATTEYLIEILPLVMKFEPTHAIVAVGANDSSLRNGKEAVPLDEFLSNLQTIFRHLLDRSVSLLYLPPLPVDEKRTRPVEYDETLFYTNDRILLYGDEALKLAEKMGVSFLDFREEWEERRFPERTPDGLHPDPSGHKFIFEKVKESLQTLFACPL